ncbi:hypothetical protein ACFVTE_14300 [Arthrobacter sp. NPDC058097]|uniref:hypothetical protein n=1 Tax=Arthrobacter sp. NPDC058097 TaxID=3346340 RepID=UPI0036DD84F7
MQFQLRRLIREILADPTLDPAVYLSLAGHLAADPRNPEQVLLTHLREIQEPADLPPFKACR